MHLASLKLLHNTESENYFDGVKDGSLLEGLGATQCRGM